MRRPGCAKVTRTSATQISQAEYPYWADCLARVDAPDVDVVLNDIGVDTSGRPARTRYFDIPGASAGPCTPATPHRTHAQVNFAPELFGGSSVEGFPLAVGHELMVHVCNLPRGGGPQGGDPIRSDSPEGVALGNAIDSWLRQDMGYPQASGPVEVYECPTCLVQPAQP